MILNRKSVKEIPVNQRTTTKKHNGKNVVKCLNLTSRFFSIVRADKKIKAFFAVNQVKDDHFKEVYSMKCPDTSIWFKARFRGKIFSHFYMDLLSPQLCCGILVVHSSPEVWNFLTRFEWPDCDFPAMVLYDLFMLQPRKPIKTLQRMCNYWPPFKSNVECSKGP